MSTERDEIIAAMEQKFRQLNRRWLLGCGVALVVLFPGAMYASTVTVPHIFASGTVARASEVNDNFAALTLEATRVSNIVNGRGDGTNSNRVVNLAPPIAGSDAASRDYVDASGGGGGSGLTLVGVTTCPTGWTSALTGIAYFTYAFMPNGTGGWVGGNPTYVCAANAGVTTAGGTSLYATAGTSNSLYWLAPQVAGAPVQCVICVR